MRENERTNLSEKGCWDRKVSKKKSLSLWANKFTFDDLIGSIADFRHLRFYGTRIYAILHTLPSVTVHKTILYSKSSATADYYRRTRTCYLCTLSSYSITQYKYILISLLVYFPFSSSFVEKKVKKKKEESCLRRTNLFKKSHCNKNLRSKLFLNNADTTESQTESALFLDSYKLCFCLCILKM